MPKLSIIVPVYKVEPYLHRCVDSILAQTFTDLEIILVNDGSPDNCGKICDKYAEQDPRVRVIHQDNNGLSAARNTGLDAAQGDYIGFVDSDDYIHPQMYETLYHCLTESQADIAVGQHLPVEETEVPCYDKIPLNFSCELLTRKEFIDNYYPENHQKITVMVWRKLFRKKIFDNIRFPVGKTNEDDAIALISLEQCNRVVLAPLVFYYYVQRKGSIMMSEFSEKRFHSIEPSYNNISFFEGKNLAEQREYAEQNYLFCFCRCYFAVKRAYPQLKKLFAPYLKQWRKQFHSLMKNSKICRLQKLMIALTFFNSNLAFLIARKYFPECLPEFL